MELKKGMYYRDKKGIIRKWGEYDRLVKDWDDRYNYYDEDGDLIFVFESEIAKYSNNLIDLIKIGDYVNGYPVNDFDIVYSDKEIRVGVIVDKNSNMGFSETYFKEKNINDVVTKEQFDLMKYVVERED